MTNASQDQSSAHQDSPGETRLERDSLGEVEVETKRLWGAQTQRSLINFDIGRPAYVWGHSVISSLGRVKKAASRANQNAGAISQSQANLISAAADEVINGDLDTEFPLVAFQTGSGTQSNMNANEVIANRANQLAGKPLGSNSPIHPNDHVNASQSSNDVFPTVMHLAVVVELHERLYPAIDNVTGTLEALGREHADLAKVGRTHLQDATPITLGQEIDAWSTQIRSAIGNVRNLESGLRKLAIGGTATGTGLNAPPGFADEVVALLSAQVNLDFQRTDNHFAATASHDPLVNISAALRTLAGALMKMSNDIRWLSSGPRNGIGELLIPANEPGSSIMPGKVNPTQAEALNMVAVHVFGNDATVAIAGASGEFQLNVYKPIILHRVLDSIVLLSDAAESFNTHCLLGLKPNIKQISINLDKNLMIVTALVPELGYEKSAKIARDALSRGLTLKQAIIESEGFTSEEYDARFNPLDLAKPHEP